MKICTGLQFKKNSEGKLILQAKWQPVQFSGTYSLQLSGEETDWQDMDLAKDVIPVEVDPVFGIVAADPVNNVTSETKSREEKEELTKSGEKKDENRDNGKNTAKAK